MKKAAGGHDLYLTPRGPTAGFKKLSSAGRVIRRPDYPALLKGKPLNRPAPAKKIKSRRQPQGPDVRCPRLSRMLLRNLRPALTFYDHRTTTSKSFSGWPSDHPRFGPNDRSCFEDLPSRIPENRRKRMTNAQVMLPRLRAIICISFITPDIVPFVYTIFKLDQPFQLPHFLGFTRGLNQGSFLDHRDRPTFFCSIF